MKTHSIVLIFLYLVLVHSITEIESSSSQSIQKNDGNKIENYFSTIESYHSDNEIGSNMIDREIVQSNLKNGHQQQVRIELAEKIDKNNNKFNESDFVVNFSQLIKFSQTANEYEAEEEEEENEENTESAETHKGHLNKWYKNFKSKWVKHHEKSEILNPSMPKFWGMLFLALFLISLAAFSSGSSIGILSIDKLSLEILSMSKNEEESKVGKRILLILEDQYLFLVTLLFVNSVASESLPVVLDTMLPDWAAILLSTVFFLFVGDIIPQTICTGQHKMKIASTVSPIIKVLIKILWIITFPISRGLNYLLGKQNSERFNPIELKNYILSNSPELNSQEKSFIILGLELNETKIKEVMIPLHSLFTISMTTRITKKIIKEIQSDFSEIVAIYKDNINSIVAVVPTNIFCLRFCLCKIANPSVEDIIKIEEFEPEIIGVNENLLDLIELFEKKELKYVKVVKEKEGAKKYLTNTNTHTENEMMVSAASFKDDSTFGFVFYSNLVGFMIENKNIEKEEQEKEIEMKLFTGDR